MKSSVWVPGCTVCGRCSMDIGVYDRFSMVTRALYVAGAE
jgi:hypothetical protein